MALKMLNMGSQRISTCCCAERWFGAFVGRMGGIFPHPSPTSPLHGFLLVWGKERVCEAGAGVERKTTPPRFPSL